MDKNDATQTLGFWLIKFKTWKLQGNMFCDPFDDGHKMNKDFIDLAKFHINDEQWHWPFFLWVKNS